MRSNIESMGWVQMIIEVPIDAFEIIRLIAAQLYDEPIEESRKGCCSPSLSIYLKTAPPF